MRARTVLPRTTLSPGSISMRCTRPDTGAVTRNLSRTRVSPSSSTVTCIGPRSARTTVTSIDCGHKATTTIAATISTEAISCLCLRERIGGGLSRYSYLQDRDEIKSVELPSDDEPRYERRADDPEER